MIMPVFHDEAKYEDNLLSFSGARLIFYHFLTLIYLFLQIEIVVTDIQSEELDPKRYLYTVESTRTFHMRKIPFLHFFLPTAFHFEVKQPSFYRSSFLR